LRNQELASAFPQRGVAHLIFFIIPIIAGVFGFTGISAAASGIAKILFFIFIIAFVVCLYSGLLWARRSSRPVAGTPLGISRKHHLA
jgi:uncharacterized membrane protein YtjA (UPF0391 family)